MRSSPKGSHLTSSIRQVEPGPQPTARCTSTSPEKSSP
jgi:hypothetical protein